MNIRNAFISYSKNEVIADIKKLCKGKELRTAIIDFIPDSMQYYVTELGEMFGCHKYKGFFLTTVLKVSERYVGGLKVRISLPGHKLKEVWLHEILYWTFVLGRCDTSLKICLRDGNKYNLSLDNIYVKDDVIEDFKSNVFHFSKEYETEYHRICALIKGFSPNDTDKDCEDAVSSAYLEVCNRVTTRNTTRDIFVGSWVNVAKKRLLDGYYYREKKSCPLLSPNGEEMFGDLDKEVELKDVWTLIRGRKTQTILNMWCSGYTPTEIADALGARIGTVGSIITHTCQNLRILYLKDIEKLK